MPKNEKKPASYCRTSLPRQRTTGVEKHETNAVSAKVSQADCPDIADLLGSAFPASGTLVLVGLSTGPALLPGSLFRELLRGRPPYRGGPVAVAVQDRSEKKTRAGDGCRRGLRLRR